MNGVRSTVFICDTWACFVYFAGSNDSIVYMRAKELDIRDH